MPSLTLSIDEAWDLTRVSKQTLRRMMREGTLRGAWNPQCYRPSLYSLLVDVMGCPAEDAMKLVAERVDLLGSSASPSLRGSNAPPRAVPRSRQLPRANSSRRTSSSPRSATQVRRLQGKPGATSPDALVPETNPGVVAGLAMIDEFEQRFPVGGHHG